MLRHCFGTDNKHYLYYYYALNYYCITSRRGGLRMYPLQYELESDIRQKGLPVNDRMNKDPRQRVEGSREAHPELIVRRA